MEKSNVPSVRWSMAFVIPKEGVDLLKKNTNRVKKLFNVDINLSTSFTQGDAILQWVSFISGDASSQEMRNAKTYIKSMTKPETSVTLDNISSALYSANLDRIETRSRAYLARNENQIVVQGSRIEVYMAQYMLKRLKQSNGDNNPKNLDLGQIENSQMFRGGGGEVDTITLVESGLEKENWETPGLDEEDVNSLSGIVKQKQSSAISQVYRMEQGVKFTYVGRRGPKHARVKVMSVTVNNQTFEGVGPSNRLAKQAAAELALHGILGTETSTKNQSVRVANQDEENVSCRMNPVGRGAGSKDKERWEEDDAVGDGKEEFTGVEERKGKDRDKRGDGRNDDDDDDDDDDSDGDDEGIGGVEGETGPLKGCKKTTKALKKLKKLIPRVRFKVISKSGPSEESNCVLSVQVGTKTFQGSGRLQKHARKDAAKQVLTAIFDNELGSEWLERLQAILPLFEKRPKNTHLVYPGLAGLLKHSTQPGPAQGEVVNGTEGVKEKTSQSVNPGLAGLHQHSSQSRPAQGEVIKEAEGMEKKKFDRKMLRFPIKSLHEQKISFRVIKVDKSEPPNCVMAIEANDKTYFGRGPNRKRALNDAAKQALLNIFGGKDSPMMPVKPTDEPISAQRDESLSNKTTSLGKDGEMKGRLGLKKEEGISLDGGGKDSDAVEMKEKRRERRRVNESEKGENGLKKEVTKRQRCSNHDDDDDVVGKGGSYEDVVVDKKIIRVEEQLQLDERLSSKPVKYLKELVPGIRFTKTRVSKPVGSLEAPGWNVSVQVDKQTFEGFGLNRRQAKEEVAKKVFVEILRNRMGSDWSDKLRTILLPDVSTSTKGNSQISSHPCPDASSLSSNSTQSLPGGTQEEEMLSVGPEESSTAPSVPSIQAQNRSLPNAGPPGHHWPVSGQDEETVTLPSHPSCNEDKNEDKNEELRYIVIDGNNVAMTHGNSKSYSLKGIKICIDYFLSRGHKVTAFISGTLGHLLGKGMPMSDIPILEQLKADGYLKVTPSRRLETGKVICCYDDRFILNLADVQKGIVVSNDQFRDMLHVKPCYKELIETRLLPYIFVGDIFMPPDDPLGQDGPTLDEFLAGKTTKTVDVTQVALNCHRLPTSHVNQEPPAKYRKIYFDRQNVHTTQPSVHTTQPSVHTTQPSVHTTQPSVHTTQPSATHVSNTFHPSAHPHKTSSQASRPNQPPSNSGVFDQKPNLKQLGVDNNFDIEIVEEALTHFDNMADSVEPEYFLDFLQFLKSREDLSES